MCVWGFGSALSIEHGWILPVHVKIKQMEERAVAVSDRDQSCPRAAHVNISIARLPFAFATSKAGINTTKQSIDQLSIPTIAHSNRTGTVASGLQISGHGP